MLIYFCGVLDDASYVLIPGQNVYGNSNNRNSIMSNRNTYFQVESRDKSVCCIPCGRWSRPPSPLIRRGDTRRFNGQSTSVIGRERFDFESIRMSLSFCRWIDLDLDVRSCPCIGVVRKFVRDASPCLAKRFRRNMILVLQFSTHTFNT